MRLIYTAYAINAAIVCFLLTLALILYEEHSHRFNFVLNCITDYMFILFGPVLFCFCIIGFTCLPGLAQDCKPDHIGQITHPSDVAVLFICSIVSFCVLFLYAAQITGKLSNQELADEHSITYLAFASCLKRGKDEYAGEKAARYALLKREEDEYDFEENGEDKDGKLLVQKCR